MLIIRLTFFMYLLIAFICVLGSPSATLAGSLEELKQALQTNDVEAAWGAVRGIPQKLSPQQKEETIKVLTKALRKEWPRCAGDFRQSIADQLAALDAKEAIPDLLELIRENKNIEHECAECGCCFLALSVNDSFLELEPDFFCENSVLRALRSLATFSYAKEISELVESTTPYRPQLLVILGKIGHPRYAHFIAKFADREPLAVAQALGEMKQPSGIPVLGRLLEDSNESVRWTASRSLTLIGGDRVVDTVTLRLHHPNKDIRALAARTLGVLGVADGLSVLRNLSRKAETLRTRCLAIAYLGQLRDLESRAIFITGLQDKSLLVLTYSIYALGYMGKPGDIPMIEASLLEAKRIDSTIPADKEALRLIDETAREALGQIRKNSGNKGVRP
jgi:HEAT repeat protein